MTDIIVQYDSIEISTIPADAVAVAGYVGGMWPTESRLVAAFPHARHKSIAISADEDADILDIERGDATPSQAPAWFRRQKARGLALPGVYTDASDMPTVIAAMTAAGIAESEYVRWMAWLGSTVIPSGMHARQYTFTALGRNLDASVCLPEFWGAMSPPVVNGPRYDWFPAASRRLFGSLLSERQTVQEYDRLRSTQTRRLHPNRPRLALLRVRLRWLAGRVWRVAHNQEMGGKPSWGVDRRGWRYQQLIHRAQGQRFV